MNLIIVRCVILLVCFQLNEVALFKLPEGVDKCHRSDSECITRATNFIIKKFSKIGNPEISLPPVEPIRVDQIIYGGRSNTPVSLTLNMTDVKLYGVSDFVFQNVSGFRGNIQDTTIYTLIYVPKLILKCQSQSGGKLLAIPIRSNGPFEGEIFNLTLQLREKLNTKLLNGHEVAYITQYKFSPKIDKMSMKFDTKELFNGDKAIGDNFIKIINENWEPLWEEISIPVFTPIVKKIIDIINVVLTSGPYDDLFLPDE